MNIVLIASGIILIICALGGLIAGFLKKASGILSFILAGALASMLLPGITGWLRTSTPVYAMVQKQCARAGESIVKNMVPGTADEGSGTDSLFGGRGSIADLIFGGNGSSVAGGDSLPGEGSGTYDDSGQASAGGQSSSGQESSLWAGILNADGSVNRDAVKSLASQYGIDPSLIDGMSDEEIKAYIGQYAGVSAGFCNIAGLCAITLPEAGRLQSPLLALPVSGPDAAALPAAAAGEYSAPALLTAGISSENGAQQEPEGSTGLSSLQPTLTAVLSSMSAADKRKLIESLPIPQSLQEQMETFNNSEGYIKLGATDFASYITSYFASLILNTIAYLISLLIAWIILHLIFSGLGIFTRIPLVNKADRILGLFLGLIQGLIIVWLMMLVFSLLSATPFGQSAMTQIYESPFLEVLYNTNIFLKSASFAMKGIL